MKRLAILAACASWAFAGATDRADAAAVARILETTGSAIVVAHDGIPRLAAVFGAVDEGEKILVLPQSTLTLALIATGQVEHIDAQPASRTLTVSAESIVPGEGVTPIELDESTQASVAATLGKLPPIPHGRSTPRRGEVQAAGAPLEPIDDEEEVKRLALLEAREEPSLKALAAAGYEQAGLLAEAIAAYEQAAKLAPTAAPLHAALGDLYLRAGREKDARAARQIAFDQGFDFTPAAQETASADAARQVRLARAFRSVYLTLWYPEFSAAEQRVGQDPTVLDETAQELRQKLGASATLLKDAGVAPDLSSMYLVDLAALEHSWQRFDAAQQSLDAAALHVHQPSIWDGVRANYWNLRGLLAAEQSRFAQSLSDHTRALELRKSLSLTVDVAQSFNNIGTVLLQLGDGAAARQALEQAAAIYNLAALREYPQIATARAFTASGISQTWSAEGDFQQAEAVLRAVVEERKKTSGREPVDLLCHNNLGLVLYNLGRFEECQKEYALAEQVAADLGPGQIRSFEGQVNRGWVRLTLGELPEAESAFRAALAGVTALDAAHNRAAEIQGYLARVLVEQGKLEEAAKLVLAALDARQRQTEQTLRSALSQRDRLAFVQMLRVHTEAAAWPGVLDAFLELAPRLGIGADKQYPYVLAWKGILSHSPRADRQSIEGNPEAHAILAELAEVRRSMRRLSGGAATTDDAASLAGLEEDAKKLERRMASLGQHATAPSPTVAQIAAAIPADAALVDIIEVRKYLPRAAGQVVADNRSYIAFILDRSGTVSRIDLGDAASIDAAVEAFVQRIAEQRSFSAQARRAGSLVAEPLQEKLRSVRLVIVSADGTLHRLPWAALPGVDSEFWLEEAAFASATSAHSLLRATRQVENAEPSWLIVGGVDYGKRSDGSFTWEHLRYSQEEAADVDRQLRGSFPAVGDRNAMMSGAAATKQAVVTRLPQSRLVHLATHGGFRDRRRQAFEIAGMADQLDSYLVFAGANGNANRDDAYLTAEEIGDLDLREVELVMLSACETARGHVQAGQGLVGLAGALEAAGAQSVVSALWKVDDAATAALMKHFYRRLLGQSSHGAIAALREAQRDLMRQDDGGYAHPFFWAAWTATASPKPSRR